MKRYKIRIELDNGNRIESTVMARNKADAIKRLQRTDKFIEFVGDAVIKDTIIVPIEIEPIDNKRFAVTSVDNKKGWYVALDLDNRIKIEFKSGMFNETQRVLPIGNDYKEADPQKMATADRELSDWLVDNFSEIL